MSWVAAATAGATLVGSGIKYFQGKKQERQAANLRASKIDPGIKPNNEARQVRDILYDRYANYNLPGYSRYAEQIKTNAASNIYNITNAASSSADVIAGVIGSQMASNNAIQNLNQMEVSGQEKALMEYLNSLNAVGQDNIRINNAELDRFESSMAMADQLEAAATQNKANATNELLTTASVLASNFMPRQSTTTAGNVIYQSPWATYKNRNKQ